MVQDGPAPGGPRLKHRITEIKYSKIFFFSEPLGLDA